MTKQSLDERIEELVVKHQYIDGDVYPEEIAKFRLDFTSILRDVLTEVLPEKGYATAWTTTGDGQYETEFLKGYNNAIDQVLTNLNNLLGEKQ